jgi:hypothetical protein
MIKRILLVTGVVASALSAGHAHAYPAHYYGHYNPGAATAAVIADSVLGAYVYRPPPPVYYVPPPAYYPPVTYPGYDYYYYRR